jgi:dimethylargininase
MATQKAVVRSPGARFAKCVSSHPLRHTIDIERARAQHEAYTRTLRELGLEVIELPRDDEHPDSCFVEDTAVVHHGRALMCRPALESRRGEVSKVESVLSEYLSMNRATDPATIEGGDVLHLPGLLVSGLTKRTNAEGARQMSSWLEVDVRTVEDPSMMHLKSHVSSLGKNRILVTEALRGHPALRDFPSIVVPQDERYAANVLLANGTVLMPHGYPRTKEILEGEGMEVIALEMDEFPKCEGAMTCLSILF